MHSKSAASLLTILKASPSPDRCEFRKGVRKRTPFFYCAVAKRTLDGSLLDLGHLDEQDFVQFFLPLTESQQSLTAGHP